MNKSRPNKLDAFSERIEEWSAEGKTLAQMQAELKADGCAVSLSSLSEYLSRRRSARLEARLFESIANGGRMSKELESAYQQNPGPDIEQLIRVTKTLIMSLQVQGAANPKLLALANSMQQTVLNYLSGRTKAELEERKLVLAEQKYQDQVERAKGVLEDKELSEGERAARMREVFGMA